MLSQDANEYLTRVGPGTPAGELLRRFWLAVAAEDELTGERPVKKVRALGEDLVLYRDGQGRLGLAEEQCPHRSASLYYGFVEEDGLRCPYHGWKFDGTGMCLDMPFEPADTPLKREVRAKTYPVQAQGGLIFAYMGPSPAPFLPRWDLMLRRDGTRAIAIQPVLECNWLQVMENSVDPAHTYYLHAHTLAQKGHPERGAYYYRPIEKLDFEIVRHPNWCGVVKRRIFGGDKAEAESGHPLIFPNILMSPQREELVMHFRLPVDDTHTRVYRMRFTPNETGKDEPQPDIVPAKDLGPVKDASGEYHLENFPSHDAMAWETQGAITDRSRENLGITDAGVALYRKLLREQIKRVEDGQDPEGVIRDEGLAGSIDIDLSEGQKRMAREEAKA